MSISERLVIPLLEDMKIIIDPDNHSLRKKRVTKDSKTGQEKVSWDIVGYYPNVFLACKRAIEYRVLSNNERLTLSQYIEQLEEVSQKYCQIIEQYSKEIKETVKQAKGDKDEY